MNFKIAIMVTGICLLGVTTASADPWSLEDRAEQYFKSNVTTEVTVRVDQKNTESTFQSSFVPLRFLFERSADNITWDNKTKTAAIERNGKQLIFSSKEVKETATRIAWPNDWFQFKNGRTLINTIYFNEIFDRNQTFEPGSEQAVWAKKLAFLGLYWIDGIYGGKDAIEHVFISFDPGGQ